MVRHVVPGHPRSVTPRPGSCHSSGMENPNLDHWEQLASIHGTGADAYYDLDHLIRGGSLMSAEESSALTRATRGQGVEGLDVLHLQCHIGCDAITMARQGARVTGVDFSPTALSRLRALAAECGVEVATREADARELPADLDRWMDGVVRVLRPGGTLVLVELHPLLLMIDSIEPLVLDFPYSFDGPRVFRGTGSYADPGAEVSWTTAQFAHSVSEVVMAATHAGLTVSHLEEHTSMGFDPRGLEEGGVEADGRYRLRIGRGGLVDGVPGPPPPLPVLVTLLATTAGDGDSP